MAQLEEEEATGGPCEGVCHCRRCWCWPSCFHRQATLPTRPQRGCALTAHCVHPRGSTLTYLCLSLPAGGLGAGVGLCGEEGKADHPDADPDTPSVLGKRLPSQRSEGGGGSRIEGSRRSTRLGEAGQKKQVTACVLFGAGRSVPLL